MVGTIRLIGATALLAWHAATMAQAVPEKPRSDVDKVGDTAESVVEKPLRDLNLMKDKIPPELLAIQAEPYSLNGLKSCAQYRTAVATMTRVLGPDIDSAAARKKNPQNPGEFALSAGASVAGSLIPGGGLIRKLSGAEAAQMRAQAAVVAGSLRRAYLKGTARAKGCKI